MKAFFRHFSYNYRDGGLRQVLSKLVGRIRSSVWSETNWLIYEVQTATYQSDLRLSLTSEELDLKRMQELGYFKALAFPERTAARLERGDKAYGFFLDGAFVNVTWTSFDKLAIEDGVAIERPGSGALVDSVTFPSFRGRGIYPEVLAILTNEFKSAGIESIILAVDPGNERSIKGIEKAGYKPIFQLSRKMRFGTSILRRDTGVGARRADSAKAA
jgi:RimJ/RimL family protein N-acetyltransferase